MKCLRRCCSVLCVFLLSFGVFCSTVSAEYLETPTMMYNTEIVSSTNKGETIIYATQDFVTNNGITQKSYFSSGFLDYVAGEVIDITHTIAINDTTIGTVIVPKGKQINFELQKMAYAIYLDNVSRYETIADSVRLLLFYEDGSMEYVDNVIQTNRSNVYQSDIKASFLPKKDVIKIEVILKKRISFQTHTVYLGETDGTHDGWYLVLDQQTKSEGLLGGLLEWVKNLFNKVTEGFSALGDGITNVFNKLSEGFSALGDGLKNLWDSILELPAKLWELISNGLKSLFVPSDEFIVQFKEDMDSMLEQKLGAVYQVSNILFDFWGRITDSDTQNTIDIPLVSIDLPEGNTFSFGGWSVPIIPQGFEFLADICKLFAGIICTWAFINGLRKRYDEVMGVEQ